MAAPVARKSTLDREFDGLVHIDRSQGNGGVSFRPHAEDFIDKPLTDEGNVAKVKCDLLE